MVGTVWTHGAGRIGAWPGRVSGFLWLLAIAVAGVLVLAPAAQAGRAKIGEIRTLPGRASATAATKGIAVNRSGAGGAGTGDVYVANAANNLVEEFSATGAFVRSFGYDVVGAGPDNSGANEEETVTVGATGGSFTLTAATAATGFGDFTDGSNVIAKVTTATGAFHTGDQIEGGCGVAAGATVTAVGSESLTLSLPVSFPPGLESCPHIAFRALEKTGAIPYDASALELEAALTALPEIAGNVAVSGGPGATAPLTVEFIGALGHNDVRQMSADAAGLSGGGQSATVATSVQGGGAEVCRPIANPADICKTGSESSVAGGMALPLGVAIDEANGNVYVVESNDIDSIHNSRVAVYSATGAFEGAFGWKVNTSNPQEELQFCTAVSGCQAGTLGGGAGQFGGDRAVSSSLPAVDPSNGDLYVTDGGNARVQVFRPTIAAGVVTGVSFVKTFGWDVVAASPGEADQSNEIQRVRVRAGAGKFTLSFGASSTPGLSFDAPANLSEEDPGGPESVEKALNALPSISAGGGSVTVGGGPGDEKGSAPYSVSFDGGPLAHTDIPQQIVPHEGTLSGGIPSTNVAVETSANGTEGLESCAASRGDSCKAGVTGGGMGEFSQSLTLWSVAVSATGEVYAVDAPNNCGLESSEFGPCRVYRFSFPSEGRVDAEEFAPGLLTHVTGSADAVAATDVAVDPASEHVLVAKKEGFESYKFLEFNSAGALLESAPGEDGVLSSGAGFSDYHGLGIGTGNRFYFSNPLGVVDIFGPPPPPTTSIEPVTDVGATSATFKGTVTPAIGPEGERFATSYHFEYSRDKSSWSRFPASDVSVGDGSGSGPPETCPANNPPICKVSQTADTLEANAHYWVRLVATNGSVATSSEEEFTTDPAAPSISRMVAEEVTKTSAILTGFVNPDNEATTYHFEWGPDTGYAVHLPAGSAGSNGEPAKVSIPISELKEGTVYHFRIVAANGTDTTVGPDQEFTTLDAFSLPDGREPEQVSPNDKRPVGRIGQVSSDQIIFQAADEGGAILYPLLNGLPDSTAGGNLEYLGRRTTSGWDATQMTPPSLLPGLGGSVHTGRVLFASADLSCQMVESFEPLTEDVPVSDIEGGIENLYLYRRNPDGSHAYTLLTTSAPSNEIDKNQESFHLDWASSNCDHVLFDTEYNYHLAGSPASGRVLYEWAEGSPLRLTGVRPDGSVAPGAVAGANPEITNVNSISSDGAKVFFSETSNSVGGDGGKTAVFVRKNGAPGVDASQSKTGTANNNDSYYQMASADGSHVFFTARYGLALNGSSGGANTCSKGSGVGCDLYDYNTNSGTLTDLSIDVNPSDARGAGVVGLLDTSDNGSYVYFASRGQLVINKGKTESENLINDTYNVYLNHEGARSYVGEIESPEATNRAVFSGTDLVAVNHSIWVADATPDGEHLLFVSKANVTGYESGGATEAYIYSAASGQVACVSCRTDGQKSVGGPGSRPIATVIESGAAALWPTVGRPRSISDDGSRVFFTSPDVLAPGAIKEVDNIYEWERGQIYLLLKGEGKASNMTRYADASTSGNDVFLVTTSKLVPQDFDSSLDVYDLRAPHVSGEKVGPEPAAEEAGPCNPLSEDPLEKQCQGPAEPQPGAEAPAASEGSAGPGNQPTPPPCQKGKVRKHGRCVKKKSQARHHKNSSAKHHHKRTAHHKRKVSR
jgi:hypothetical protein